jgi:hypothetical protein
MTVGPNSDDASGNDLMRDGRGANWFEPRHLKVAGRLGLPPFLCTPY